MSEKNQKREKGVCESCGTVQEVKWVGGTLMCEVCEKKHQKKDMFEISYMVHIERKKFPKKIIEILKKNNVNFGIWELYNQKAEYYDPEEEVPLVEIELELYQKLKKISEITGIPIEDMASNELNHLLTDFIPEDPFIFLDAHLGIENVKNPIEIIEQLKEIVNIGDKYFEALKIMDPVKYVKEWNTGRIKTNKEETITISISIPKELYDTIDELCKINNLDTNDKINNILGTAVFSAEIDEDAGHKHVFNF